MDNAHTAVTLLPCEHCGSPAAVGYHCGVYYGECSNEENCGHQSPMKWNEAEAITAWNQRATTADLQARLDACEARNAELVMLLEAFREYVIQNSRGLSHHDPLWVKVADALATTRNADAQGGGDEAASHAFNERDAWADIDDRHRAEGL